MEFLKQGLFHLIQFSTYLVNTQLNHILFHLNRVNTFCNILIFINTWKIYHFFTWEAFWNGNILSEFIVFLNNLVPGVYHLGVLVQNKHNLYT